MNFVNIIFFMKIRSKGGVQAENITFIVWWLLFNKLYLLILYLVVRVSEKNMFTIVLQDVYDLIKSIVKILITNHEYSLLI